MSNNKKLSTAATRRAQIAGLCDLLLDLVRNHAADGIIRQVQERVDHVKSKKGTDPFKEKGTDPFYTML